MKPPLIVLDCHYLCHRAFHSQPRSLEWKGRATGVIYGFLQTIGQLQKEFNSPRIAFCFESKTLKRKAIYPNYKQSRIDKREEGDADAKKAYNELTVQIAELRERHLRKIGWRNVFSFEGMEADDIMASIAQNKDTDDEVILVTGDSDLWQCLSSSVNIYQPTKQKLLTVNWFLKTHGFLPSRWALVKAIAGCQGDGVKGVGGVGEKTAIKFIQGKLPDGSKAYQTIMSREGKDIVWRNRDLVELPFKGCPVAKMLKDEVKNSTWVQTCIDLGFKSLMHNPPQF